MRGFEAQKRLFWVGLCFFTAALAVNNILVPLQYKKLFDGVFAAGADTGQAKILTGIVITIGFLRLFTWSMSRAAVFFFNYVQAKGRARLKQNAFDSLVGHSYSFFANNYTGSLVQSVNRFSISFGKALSTFIFNFLPLLIMFCSAVAVTFINARPISYLLMGWVLLFLALNIIFSRWKLKYDIESAKADSKTTAVLADDITNHNEIALFCGQARESAHFKEISNDQARKNILAWNLDDILDSVQVFMTYAVEFIVFYFAIIFWQKGQMTIGTFTLIQMYVLGLSQYLWAISRVIRDLYESLADSREMVQIMELPHEVRDLPGASTLKNVKGSITFENASFSFNETRRVLENINISIGAGEKIALVGPSGTGKTTFIGLLLRLYDPSEGIIKIDGHDIKRATLESLRSNIGVVSQDPILFHRSIMENIRYGRPEASDQEVVQAACLAHCDEFVVQMPEKYQTFVGERGIKLSGGERQRIAIARAILKNAPILILDEATSSLDSHSEALIQDALAKLMAKRTAIAIAHRLSTISNMDRIVVMDNGNIAETGTHQSLIRKKTGIYKNLWKLQAGGFIE